VNNDGRADLFVAKGNVDAMPDFAQADPNNLLLQQADGTFREAGDIAGVASTRTSRGAALADFNLDGALDLVVVNRREGAQLWQNTGEGLGHWLQLRPHRDGPNRDAVGGWIEVRCAGVTLRRELTVGGGHAGGQSGWWHFGLGPDTEAEVRILWPDGTAGAWQRVAADGFYLLDPSGARPWRPAGR
jgi:hypothetical protein